ncbi:hypothetical protein D5086_009663 [Populus alba]|uniref:Uncharacterized protein n=1 Tax=Populus alba TaxID=43335 RepID=A0ACC4C751_POPAL
MATDTAPSHQTPSDHEPMEKMTEEVKPVEPEIVSVAKKTEEEEEELKPNELASQSTPLAKSEGEAEDEAEPPAVEVKMIDDAPVVDVPVDYEKELEKDSIPDSDTFSVLAPVTSVVNGESVAPAIEFVSKEAEEQPLSSSLEELPHEEPKTVDVPVSLEEAIEKPHEPSEVLIIKESEPTVAKNTEDSGVEIKPTNEKPEEVAGITQEAEVDVKEDIGKSSLPEVVGKVGPENEKKEAEGTDPVEVLVKEVVVEAEKGGEEKEAQTTKDKGENIASETLKEELAHPIKVEDVSDAVSNAKVTEKSFEGEKTVENVVPAVEDKKEEIPAGEETEKDQKIEGKLDEATTIGSETVEESQDSGLEAKEEESAKNNKENSEQEKVDEIAKSDTQNLEPSTTKDADDIKVSQDLPREVPAKPTQKHSNNILTKVKQSLVKAKKAIIGKSPTPKTVSSDTKGDVKVNN